MSTQKTNMWIGLWLPACLSACGSGGAAGTEGVYQVETWTDNQNDCAAEGPSVLTQHNETIFYLELGSLLGTDFLGGTFCADVAACQALAAEDTYHATLLLNFNEGNDADGWMCHCFMSGANVVNGVCNDANLWETSLDLNPDHSLRIERRVLSLSGFPADNGRCTIDGAIQVASSGTCTSREVLNASFLADL